MNDWHPVGGITTRDDLTPYVADNKHIYRIVCGEAIHAPLLTSRRAGLLVRKPACKLPDRAPGVRCDPLSGDA